MKTKESDRQTHQQHSYHNLHHLRPEISLDRHQNNSRDVVQNKTSQESQKCTVILPSNAHIQVLAVMIQIQGTPVASETVVALLRHQVIAQNAEEHFVRVDLVLFDLTS